MATHGSSTSSLQKSIGKEAPPVRSFLRNDFPFIRKASTTFAICLLFSVSLSEGSNYLLSQKVISARQAQLQRNQARDKLARTHLEKREILDFMPKYNALVARGFVGEEKRLAWVEQIRLIQTNRKLLSIAYDISTQQPVPLDAAIPIGDLELRVSKMLIKMRLLHEMDLFNFLADLKGKGFYTPTSCAISQIEAVAFEGLVPRLTAECILYWITLGPRVPAKAQ